MEELNTEQKIKQAARKIFIRKGMSGARMQEIADEAGINKALLHYYYRSKEQLFHSIFDEVVSDFMPKLFFVLNGDIPLEVKVYQLAEKYIDFISQRPDLPFFMLGEMRSNPQGLIERLDMKHGVDFSQLRQQLENAAAKGQIRPISVESFLINLVGLLIFPFMGRPLLQAITQMSDADFNGFMEERKKEVPRFIMNALKI